MGEWALDNLAFESLHWGHCLPLTNDLRLPFCSGPQPELGFRLSSRNIGVRNAPFPLMWVCRAGSLRSMRLYLHRRAESYTASRTNLGASLLKVRL